MSRLIKEQAMIDKRRCFVDINQGKAMSSQDEFRSPGCQIILVSPRDTLLRSANLITFFSHPCCTDDDLCSNSLHNLVQDDIDV